MTHLDAVKLPSRARLAPGSEFTARGIRGRLRFRHAVADGDGQVLSIEAFDRDGRYRSVAPDRVKTVHVKCKTQPAQGIPARNMRGRR